MSCSCKSRRVTRIMLSITPRATQTGPIVLAPLVERVSMGLKRSIIVAAFDLVLVGYGHFGRDMQHTAQCVLSVAKSRSSSTVMGDLITSSVECPGLAALVSS